MRYPKVDQQVTFLYCNDLKETAHFYEEIIGFKQVLDQGGCRIYRICDNGFLGFCYREGTKPGKDGIVYTIVTDEVDMWYAYLKDRGVDLDKAPEENPVYKIYHFFFRDPNGYLLEVQKFMNPIWPGEGS